ncbi:MAG: dihydroneopterin aldolase [Burkholderiaceae bacterium]|jgi:dihydroneopterin aldolase|nr:dihydroneopterin aldolase [Burkholderiaceae bacterium]
MTALLLHPSLAGCRRVFLRNHEMFLSIGVHESEKKQPQRLLVNVELFIPLSVSTPQNDDITEVIDYAFIRDVLDNIGTKEHINLQETLCDGIARQLLSHRTSIRAVRVSTEKPDVYANAESIGVEIFLISESP